MCVSDQIWKFKVTVPLCNLNSKLFASEGLYRVIHEECHSFRELICHIMLMETFIWIWVRFSIVSEKTTYIFTFGMKPCEPRSLDLHSAWDKQAISWYWWMSFLTGNITAWLSGLPDWAISRELCYPRIVLATVIDSAICERLGYY